MWIGAKENPSFCEKCPPLKKIFSPVRLTEKMKKLKNEVDWEEILDQLIKENEYKDKHTAPIICYDVHMLKAIGIRNVG